MRFNWVFELEPNANWQCCFPVEMSSKMNWLFFMFSCNRKRKTVVVIVGRRSFLFLITLLKRLDAVFNFNYIPFAVWLGRVDCTIIAIWNGLLHRFHRLNCLSVAPPQNLQHCDDGERFSLSLSLLWSGVKQSPAIDRQSFVFCVFLCATCVPRKKSEKERRRIKQKNQAFDDAVTSSKR